MQELSNISPKSSERVMHIVERSQRDSIPEEMQSPLKITLARKTPFDKKEIKSKKTSKASSKKSLKVSIQSRSGDDFGNKKNVSKKSSSIRDGREIIEIDLKIIRPVQESRREIDDIVD